MVTVDKSSFAFTDEKREREDQEVEDGGPNTGKGG